MKKYSICLFVKVVRGATYSERVLVEKPDGNTIESTERFIQNVKSKLEHWGETSTGGTQSGYYLRCEMLDIQPTKELIEESLPYILTPNGKMLFVGY
jgi:hypothetical protein